MVKLVKEYMCDIPMKDVEATLYQYLLPSLKELILNVTKSYTCFVKQLT